MAIEVAKVELKSVQDASGLEERIAKGQFTADEVIAVIGKTEGNGGVNDFTRILADQAFRRVLARRGTRSEAAIAAVPMVWSGGCDGVITPHATVFARNARTGPVSQSRLAIGTAMSAELKPEDIGRPAMVEKVAAAVKDAMRDAGIADPKDVHYVQTKTPLLTIDSVRDAESRGQHVACEVHDSMGVSNGTTALGIAVGLGEIAMPRAEQICKDLDLYSSVASCSSGVELTQAQIVLLGNKGGAGGRYRIGHAVMRDALDIDGIYDAIRDAGLALPARPRADDLEGRVVNCFMKCEADRRGTLRGRRQIMLDDSDVHHHRHSKAAVGGVAAAAIGDPAVFVSVDAMHQGPQGGGPVIAIVDAGDRAARGTKLASSEPGSVIMPNACNRRKWMLNHLRAIPAVLAGLLALSATTASAADKVKVGMFPVSSSLPFYVALDLGYFKELGIEPEVTRLMGGPPNVAALMTNQIEVSAVLVTLEGLNANVKKPGVAMYIAMHSQNVEYKMEQFVAGTNSGIKSLTDFKGKKLLSSPGPANVNTAKGVLARIGLKDGDYTIDQLDQGQHINAIKAGTFDGGYTLEPSATIIAKTGAGYTVEAGVIAKYILGDATANAYAAGCAFTSEFIKARPDVAKRFAAGWAKAIDYIRANPAAARKHLAKNTLTPEDLVDIVPMLGYTMTKDMSPKQREELQKFADFGTSVGVVPEKIDVSKVVVGF